MPADLKRVKEIFLAAVEKADPQERAAFLREACGGEAALRQQVEGLLGQHEQAGSFLESPPPGLPQTVDSDQGEAVPPSPPAARPEAVGSRIGPYKLLQQLGEGGMGTVYLAEQQEPVKRRAALKIIKAGMDSAHVLARFEQERQALALMDHPHIAKVLDGGETPPAYAGGSPRPYFVMELVKGIPITKYCDQEHLTPKERLELFIPVCQAVQHAHQKGIIHRDLKPSNVLIALYDGKPIPKVIDFGVAKATGQKLTERTMFTEAGQMVGTLEYMAPEQAELNNLDIDTRADIYSLGVLLYELLTGSPPFTAKQLRSAAFTEMLRMIREVEPPKPSTKLSSSDELPSIAAQRELEPKKLMKLVQGELDWIVMKCLEKERGRRYETANGLAREIQRYLADEPVAAGPPSAGYRLRKFVRRNKRGLATVALLGVMLLAAVGAVAGTLGWAAHDRAARRLVVEQAVTRALEEADERQKQGKWQEALTAVERAQAALASGEGGTDLQEQVADQLAVLRMIARLEEIRARWLDYFDGESADGDYARAFADFGIDVNRLSPAEVAARILRRPTTAVRMAGALDIWAIVRRTTLCTINRIRRPGSGSWKPPDSPIPTRGGTSYGNYWVERTRRPCGALPTHPISPRCRCRACNSWVMP
ncbi:MAG: serine/threonine protein kinase [Planctomycetes bacterium]|nr:serine/threonine protein kinase [Planctomycetota bacterium]